MVFLPAVAQNSMLRITSKTKVGRSNARALDIFIQLGLLGKFVEFVLGGSQFVEM
jgi:hypothetical protein